MHKPNNINLNFLNVLRYKIITIIDILIIFMRRLESLSTTAS